MKLISWNTNHRRLQAEDQAKAILDRQPDLVALQEVLPSTAAILVAALSSGGLRHVRASVSAKAPQRRGPRSYGVLIASRYPLVEDRSIALAVPWEEKAVSVLVTAPGAEVEVHTVHVPPGSSNAWIKVDVLEAVFMGLSRQPRRPRLLCGDFNTPQRELPTGEIVTWAQRIGTSGEVYLRARLRGGPGPRWDAAERNVLSGLGRFGMRDVYREVHGYGTEAWSWVLHRKGTIVRRRFDHLFASHHLRARRCAYLDSWRQAGLSDHAALEAEFETL